MTDIRKLAESTSETLRDLINQLVLKHETSVLEVMHELNAENQRLRAALRGLHDDTADYIRLNNLGGYDNHWMKAAREALGGT